MEEAKKLLLTIVVFGGIIFLLAAVQVYQLAVYGWGFIAFEDALTLQVEEQQTKLGKLIRRNTIERDKATKELETLEGMKEVALQLMPDELKTRELVGAISNKGKGLVLVNEIKPVENKSKTTVRRRGPAVASDPYEAVVYEMELRGSFDEIATFINVMEMFELSDEEGKSKKQFFAVQDIEIEADQEGLTKSGSHTVNLKLVTYRYVPAEPTKRGGK